jgi:hypothetical protein
MTGTKATIARKDTKVVSVTIANGVDDAAKEINAWIASGSVFSGQMVRVVRANSP